MFEEVQTVHTLNKEGKLDKGLRIRLALFISLAIIFGMELILDIFVKKVAWYSLIVPFVLGFIFGLYVLSRLNSINWDKKKRMVTVGRIDVVGITILVAYWVVRVDAKYLLSPFYHSILTISGATFSLIFGIMVGRLSGVFRKVHQVHQDSRIRRK